MVDEARIEKLQAAVKEHPNNELAQFSLGSALLEAERFEEAGPCFQRVVAVNSQNSKAYELLGTVQKRGGHNDLAIQTLTNGYRVAQRRGDIKPMDAMASLLKELGAEVPAAPVKKVSPEAGGRGGTGFSCRRCGGAGPQLEKQPFKGELGEVVLATVCGTCWREWVGMGTKVINELRLPMYELEAQTMYDKHMKEFLLID